MAQGKFAAVTASLLARKGEAAPWAQSVHSPLAWRGDAMVSTPLQPVPPPAVAPPAAVRTACQPPLPPPPETRKRCTVRLTQGDYERLGLMAVKKDVTRQQLLQTALTEVLGAMARELSRGCACIGESCGQACGAGNGSTLPSRNR